MRPKSVPDANKTLAAVQPRGSYERGGGGGSGTQKFVYQNRPDKIFSIAIFPRWPIWSWGGRMGPVL